MAQGRRPDPFRTRKLRPGTAMVLHPEGCGRVARRRTQTLKGRGHHTCPLPFHIPGHTQPHGTRHTGTTPSHTRPVNRQRTTPHTRQARHTGTKDYRLGRSIPSRMRRHTQPRRKAPGNDGTARASAGPRMPAHTQRRVTGTPGQPGACFRHTAHVPAYAFEKTPRPARQARLHPPRPARTRETHPMPRHAHGHNTRGDHQQ